MPPKVEYQPINLVDSDNSDDEDSATRNRSSNTTTQQTKLQNQQNSGPIKPSASSNQALDCRSFWKAGAYEIGPTTKFASTEGQLEHARVHPKFLHSNATSHKWAFGAIAELLDNAVDEIHNGATFVKVDKIDIMKDSSPALLFQDDGGGMNPEGIRKCMSLGYSSKKTNTTIGQYGNGFKTSTMRLGADAIVLSRSTHKGQATQSVGLLSYTFLRRTGQDDVIVPMIDFDVSGNWAEPIIYSSQDDWSSNLKTILEWSPFSSKEELMLQFEDIGTHGTKVIIFNLWLNDEGIYELSFDDDDEDIRLRDEASRGASTKINKRVVELQNHISYRMRYSLRAYASLLYLRKFTNFKIILRGKPVQQYNVADDFKYPKVIMYRPQLGMGLKEVLVETTIGFIKEAPTVTVSGFNVYHKNRLIRPFWKVTSDGTSKGHGVVGVLEANFIEPAHDKQDFERSSLFIRLESRLKQMIMEYWHSNCHHMGYLPPGQKKHQTEPPPGLVANLQKQFPADQYAVGLPANVHENMHVDQSVAGLVVNRSSDAVTSIGSLGSISADQLCEENIQLFTRCEEHALKETELKKRIEDLERELEETKRKCAQLSSRIQMKKRLKDLEQTGKF